MVNTTYKIGILQIGICWRGGCWHSTETTPWLYWTAAARYDREPIAVLVEIIIFRMERGTAELMDATKQDQAALLAQAAAHAAELVETAEGVLGLVQRALCQATDIEQGRRLAKANAELSEAIVATYSAAIDLGAVSERERVVGLAA